MTISMSPFSRWTKQVPGREPPPRRPGIQGSGPSRQWNAAAPAVGQRDACAWSEAYFGHDDRPDASRPGSLTGFRRRRTVGSTPWADRYALIMPGKYGSLGPITRVKIPAWPGFPGVHIFFPELGLGPGPFRFPRARTGWTGDSRGGEPFGLLPAGKTRGDHSGPQGPVGTWNWGFFLPHLILAPGVWIGTPGRPRTPLVLF